VEYQTNDGPVIAPGFQQKKIRRGNRKEHFLTWPEELKLIKRLHPFWMTKGHSDRKTAGRLIVGRYYYRQVDGGWTDKAIAAQLKRSGWPDVSPSAIKRDRQRLEKISKRVDQLKADSGVFFMLPEVSAKVGMPLSELILWLKSGWIEGTGIDAEGEDLEIYPWWVLSLKQMVTLSEKWESRLQELVL